MLSYRHAFHAGNHADVLKHLVLVQLIRYMEQKDKPFMVVDTHAGAGCYSLESDYANKLAEYEGGIGRLWERNDLPPALADYVGLVRQLIPSGKPRLSPVSPWLTWKLAREADRLRFYELHSSDVQILGKSFKDAGRQVMVTLGDGFAGLKASLPPLQRRALVLIDPSYELKTDYAAVFHALEDSLTRFPTGTYAVWYPQIARIEARKLPDRLKRLPVKSWLHVSLSVHAPSAEAPGMAGSGMFILNPPWTLEAELKQIMPYLVDALGTDAGAGFTLEYQENPNPTALAEGDGEMAERGESGKGGDRATRAPRAPREATPGRPGGPRQMPGRPAGKPGSPTRSPRTPGPTPPRPRKVRSGG